MNEVQNVLNAMRLVVEDSKKNKVPIEIRYLESWAGILQYAIEQQQKPSDGGRTTSEVNRDVHSAATIRDLMNRTVELVDDLAKLEKTMPKGLSRNYVAGARRDIWRASYPLEVAMKWEPDKPTPIEAGGEIR